MKISHGLIYKVLETDDDIDDMLFVSKDKESPPRFHHGFDDGVSLSSRRGKTSKYDKRRERRLIRAVRHGELEPKSFANSSDEND